MPAHFHATNLIHMHAFGILQLLLLILLYVERSRSPAYTVSASQQRQCVVALIRARHLPRKALERSGEPTVFHIHTHTHRVPCKRSVPKESVVATTFRLINVVLWPRLPPRPQQSQWRARSSGLPGIVSNTEVPCNRGRQQCRDIRSGFHNKPGRWS